MPRAGKLLAGAAGALCLLFLAGFALFATVVVRSAPSSAARGDGIVALTGGEHRLSEAVRLLSEGRGKRLLVSGVYRATTKDELARKSGVSAELFHCCVDIGYAAHDTSGNAEETREWARSRQFGRLIIVTSSYHMPRTLAELGRVMPDVALVPYPVTPTSFRAQGWWLHAPTARLLFSEYLKFLPSAARYAASRILSRQDSALAGGSGRSGSHI